MTHATPINTHCPWSGAPVAGDSITTYRQHPVAFCNPGCRDRFERATALFDGALASTDDGLRPFLTRAVYNEWMNEKLLAVLDQLSEDDYRRNLGAFFGSIHRTMNHLLVWDIVWLKRLGDQFTGESTLAPLRERAMPTGQVQELCADRVALGTERAAIDAVLLAYAREVGTAMGAQVLDYATQKGERVRKRVDGVLTHLFNHQTHHRGQVTTLLSQLGVDPGPTDLLLTLDDF